MEFLAFEDGTLRDERYRHTELIEEPFQKTRKVYLQQPNATHSSLADFQDTAPSNGVTTFSHNPKSLVFENFIVNETYTMVLTLINCTNRSTTFRALPISPKYRDVLRAEYSPPPKLSPGLSWKVKIIFTPVENVDVETAVAFRTEEGILFVPVKALHRRSVLSFSPENLDFGVVVFGEKVSRVLTLRNDGALPAKVFISGSLRRWMEVLHKDLQSGKEAPVVSVKPVTYQMVVNPFSSCTLEVTFSPHQDTTIDDDIELRYESEDITCVRKIPVKGFGGSLPVYVSSSPEIDFRWCFYENTYCDKITITNATNVSVTVVPEIPPMIASSLSFSPANVCVQANDTFDVYVFFTPRRGLETVISTLVKLIVSGQASPISVTLKASLTERGFTVEPSKLDYGVSGPDEEIIFPLKVKNLSSLPQTLGFLKLPENVRIVPFQTITLLPKEIVEFKVGVRPPTLGQYTQVVKVTNEYGDYRTLQLTGCGRKYSMQFSKPCVSLSSCPTNAETSCTTVLQNRGSTPQKFCLNSTTSLLRVSPSSGVLYPGEAVPVVVIFEPPSNQPIEPVVEEIVARPVARFSTKKGKEREGQMVLEKNLGNIDDLYKEWESNSPEEEWSRHRTFFIKCTCGTESYMEMFFLQVNCTVIKPTLLARFLSRVDHKVLTKNESTKRNLKKNVPVQPVMEQAPLVEVSPSGTHLTIEFGEVPLKHYSEKAVFLQYNGEKAISLRIRPTDTLSPFRIVKLPPAILSQNEECAMGIRFLPTEYGLYKDHITIASTEANDIILSFSGVCRPADLLISRDRDVAEGRMHSIERLVFESVEVGHEAREQMFFHNLSSLPIEVHAKFVTEEGEKPEWPEAQSFVIECDQFTIPGNCKMSTNLLFCPQAVGIFRLSLHVSAGAYEHTILVEGRACDKFVFFTFPDQSQLTETRRVRYPSVHQDVFPTDGLSALCPVQFHCITGETKTITVG
ncbi:hypothetical protein DQ04_00191300, partial [Trypanosoma grayi]|uniref:hypothetical protein n=1 Tax=Trypanosoma grayi TaxID=71804 RepID=UPI0004F40D0D